MFTDADKQNLIKELNKEIETNTFYNNPLISSKTKARIDNDSKMSKVSFESMSKSSGNIAFSDTVFNSTISIDDIKLDEKNATSSFKTDGLFRPLVNKDSVNLNNKIYNYSSSYLTPVHGIAFEKQGRENVDNPLTRPCNIVNNIYANSPSWGEASEKKTNDSQTLKKEIYMMSDVLKNTKESQIISFATVPKELSLVASPSKWKSVLYKEINLKEILLKEIDIKGALKSAFEKR